MFDARVWAGFIVLTGLAAVCLAIGFKWFFWGFLLLSYCHLSFFRDPTRELPEGDGILSPADGKVVEIATVKENEFMGEPAIKVGIFLSIFNVHINRAPCAGKIGYLKYVPGQFLNALKKESVDNNEHQWIGIESEGRRVMVRQIAGAIARRICCDVKMGEMVERGSKIGIICYGSRTELYVPEKLFRVLVKEGDKVKAGETILGEWK
jgi:phosphatidylserine decarboxylase